VIEARLGIAQSLLERDGLGDRDAALMLAREAQRAAARIGMRQTARNAFAMLKQNDDGATSS
jgi:hypothetical protein